MPEPDYVYECQINTKSERFKFTAGDMHEAHQKAEEIAASFGLESEDVICVHKLFKLDV